MDDVAAGEMDHHRAAQRQRKDVEDSDIIARAGVARAAGLVRPGAAPLEILRAGAEPAGDQAP